jgi:hypothetical protein
MKPRLMAFPLHRRAAKASQTHRTLLPPAVLFISLLLYLPSILQAQVSLKADGPGNTYELIESVLGNGTTGEVPDCAHPAFGRHITEAFDAELNRNVFIFHIHVTPDNDRCGPNTDRQRNEIKTFGSSPDNVKGTLNETVTYRWKFKIDAGFVPTSSFCHIHQIKAGDGDAGAPIITLTPRAGSPQKLQVIHSTGSGGTGGEVASANLADFKGVWVDVTEKVKYSTSGSYQVLIKRVSDGAVLLSYTNNNINMWRDGTTFCRPKWGIYRKLVSGLRDEQVRFADFCIAEGAVPCPDDTDPGTPPGAIGPEQDAYVRSGVHANTAFGATDAGILIAKLNSSGSADNDRHTYLTFDLGNAGTISKAVLKLNGKIDDARASNVPVGVFSVASTSWSETTLTWNNKPAASASALVTANVSDATARYYSWDVSAYVKSEQAAGHNKVSFALKSAQVTDPRITFSSKETGNNPPRLEITTTAALSAEKKIPGNEGEVQLNVYPNPFAQNATIDIDIKEAGRTMVEVFDMQQRRVAVPVNAYLQTGTHRTVFDSKNMPPGTYVVRVTNNGKTYTKIVAKQ